MVHLQVDGVDFEVWIECNNERLVEYNIGSQTAVSDGTECWVASEAGKVRLNIHLPHTVILALLSMSILALLNVLGLAYRTEARLSR